MIKDSNDNESLFSVKGSGVWGVSSTLNFESFEFPESYDWDTTVGVSSLYVVYNLIPQDIT